jgi:hypothetical protein
MTHHAPETCALLLAALVASTICAGAARANDISFIKTAGKNTNACTLKAPCRSLRRAIAVTAAGGEIRVLDSGFFGNNATIRKSLTISGNGHTVFLGNPVIVNKANAIVTLRGLVLNGLGSADDGIRINAAAAVHIERSVVQGFSQYGIVDDSAGVAVFVSDSISRDNGEHGILMNSPASRLTVDNSHFENNGGHGVVVLNGRATIHRATASGNAFHGIASSGISVSVMSTMAADNASAGFLAGNGGTMTVESSIAHGNGGAGLLVAAGGFGRTSNSTFTGNTIGISNGGTIETRGNNTVRGNGTNLSGGALTQIGGL